MQPDLAKFVTAHLNRPIILTGMMGTGKSHLGRLLAQMLKVQFFDSDTVIEQQESMSIAEIFSERGEPAFREIERRVISDLIAAPDQSGTRVKVISLGGGAVTDGKTRELLAEKALTVWIDTSLDNIWKRIKWNTSRPLLACENPRKALEDLMHKRRELYATADLRFVPIEDHCEASVKKMLRIVTDYIEHHEQPTKAKPENERK